MNAVRRKLGYKLDHACLQIFLIDERKNVLINPFEKLGVRGIA